MQTPTPPPDFPVSDSTMFSFKPVTNALANTARVGTLVSKNIRLETPTFIVPGSRGVVPHLSHDNLRDHTSIKGVHMALEDCAQFLRLSASFA
jgi:queuine tRNA-ribosyltransferase subunit QTRTD1